MHPLIDDHMVEAIRTTGKGDLNLPDRRDVLEKYDLPYDKPAENVIISGCMVLSGLPHVLRSLFRILERKNLSCTFLSVEYCCGNFLYRPAIKADDAAALTECRVLSKEFVGLNLNQAKRLGAKRLVIFCSPCYPIYKYAFPDENIVFYPTAIAEVMEEITFQGKIDYYAGCYSLHQKFAPVPVDLGSTDTVFSKMKGLDVHRISSPPCCYSKKGVDHMIQGIQTQAMVHICTGCYYQGFLNLPKDTQTEILMLPEFVERATRQ